MRCGVKCRAADPGSATTPSLRRSRVCSAALRLSYAPHCARETATEHFRSGNNDTKKRSRGALPPAPRLRGGGTVQRGGRGILTKSAPPSTMLASLAIATLRVAFLHKRRPKAAYAPSPTPFHCTGADKQIRSRGAFFAPEFCGHQDKRRSKSFRIRPGNKRESGAPTETVSSALVVIAKGRIAELVKLEMPYPLREMIIKRSSDKESTFSEDDLMPLLTVQFDPVRKVTALKVIRSFAKRRIQSLLRRYLAHDGVRFYNVIYWLDFGVSLAKATVIRATNREIWKG